MTADPPVASSFHDSRLVGVDFNGAILRDCDMRNLRAIDCWLVGVELSGWVERLVVNDVDVTPYITAELERRYPEKAQVRTMQTLAEVRAAWATLERLWSETIANAQRLPPAALYERVGDEWSFVETNRHLVFVVDAWVLRTVVDEENPFDPLGLSHTSYPREEAMGIGLDVDGSPSFDEVMAVRLDRDARVSAIVAALTETELDRVCTRAPAPGYPDETRTVRECLRVLMDESCEHRRYALRDLAVLAG